MDITGYYQTVNHPVQIKNTINKSRFIASVQEIRNEEESREFLKRIIQQFPDANHHCWAYQYGVGKEEVFQYSDSGEPANAAGPPILQAIKREKITNVAVIVSRYFGGIKLGIGGLTQAYRNTTLAGLRAAGKIRKFPLREFILEGIEYQALGAILQSIESQSGRIDDIHYGEKVKIITCLPDTFQGWIIRMVKNATQGKASIRLGEIRWYH